MTIIIRRIDSESFELDIRVPRVVSIKLDQKKLRQIDDMVKKTGYKNRSELIRDAIEVYMRILEQTLGQQQGESPQGQGGIDPESIKEKILSKFSRQA